MEKQVLDFIRCRGRERASRGGTGNLWKSRDWRAHQTLQNSWKAEQACETNPSLQSFSSARKAEEAVGYQGQSGFVISRNPPVA